MKKILFFWGALIIVTSSVFAQGDNCSNPKPVNLVCPTTVSFAGETTVGFTNDVPSWGITMNGKDRVYEVTVPAGSLRLLVSITSATLPLYVISTNNNCSGSHTSRTHVYPYLNNISIPISGTGPFYIWIDHTYTSDITYNIGFGVITSTTPNTSGSWTTANSCISPITKPGLEISYNGSRQDLPLYYSPLYTPGQVCATFFFQNLTGSEGIKSITFESGPHLSGFAPSVSSMPGFYNSGTWNATTSGNVVTWMFTDAAGIGRGDFTGTPNSCLAYTFCFNMTPLSNDPFGTLIEGLAYPDGFGRAKDIGCCPTPGNCSASTASTGNAIGFAFDDPPLPVTLLNFSLKKESGYNLLEWQTSSEYNSSSFDIERSETNKDYTVIGSVKAAGESNQLRTYSWKDEFPASKSYYRLKQIDKDGSYQYSKTILSHKEESKINIYPNPANEFIAIECSEKIIHIRMFDILGNAVLTLDGRDKNMATYNISSLTEGIYILSLQLRDQVITKKIVIGND